jgi:5-(carboxyamino)imidazole ribonucleotide synthase
MPKSIQELTIGILGGGQLGRMLIQSGIDLNLDFHILDPDKEAPCHNFSNFTQGKLTDYNAVLEFGKSCDVITIEIENVNTAALQQLANQGKKVFPQPHLISLIQDKCLQKTFFLENNIPTADVIFIKNKAEAKLHAKFLPAVNKLAREGYDGRGVQVIKDESQMHKAFDAPGLLEKYIDFEKEISIIVARNEQGEIATYPAVEMVFHKEANLVEYLFSPATLAQEVLSNAEKIAQQVIETMKLVGILAVEMFVTKEGEVLVNEVAPRPHNSGHQTIEANVTSQYQQHLRAILNLPLGDTKIIQPSAMVNILGEPGYEGNAVYNGLDDVLKMSSAYVHLYGKKTTKPFRKMGHVTLLEDNLDQLKMNALYVKEKLKVISDK